MRYDVESEYSASMYLFIIAAQRETQDWLYIFIFWVLMQFEYNISYIFDIKKNAI